MKPHSGSVLGASLLVLAFAACGHDAAESPPVTVTDSAGRLHVSLGPLAEITTPRWRVEEDYGTGSGASRLELFDVTAARFLADGSLALANAGTDEIVFLDPTGTERARMGAEGEGPGEFARISALVLDSAGDVVAYDPRLGRMTTVDPAGGVSRTRRIAPASRVVDLHPLALLEGGRVLAVHANARIFSSAGIRRDSTPLLVLDTAGDVADTLGVWPADEWNYVSFAEGSARTEVGFGRTLAHAGRDGFGVLGSTDTLNLTVYDREARAIMTITGGGPNRPVGVEDVDRWRAGQLERAAAAPEFLKDALSEAPHHEVFPAFRDLLMDDARRVWIGTYPRLADTEQHWIAIGPEGRLEGTVALPAGVRVLDAAGDRLAVLRRNELDEEEIAVLRLMGR